MSDVNWVSGVSSAFVVAASITRALPTGIEDNDLVLAFVFGRSAVTAPSGWTFVTSRACEGGGTTQTVYCYTKDTVLSTDSGVNHTWTQVSSLRMGATYAVLRGGSGGVARVAETAVTGINNATLSQTTPTALTPVREEEVILVVGTNIGASTGTFTPTPPPGFTLWTGNAADMRLAGAYRVASAGEANYGNFTLSSSFTNNGVGAITVRVFENKLPTEQVDGIQASDTYDSSGSIYVPSMLETVRVSDYALYGNLFEDALVDAVALAEQTVAFLPIAVALVDAFRATATNSQITARAAVATDTVGIAPVVARLYRLLPEVVERPRVVDASTRALKYAALFVDAIRVAELVSRGVPVSLAETVGLARVVTATRAITVLEALRMTPVLSPATRFRSVASDTVTVADLLRRFFSGDAVETVSVGEAVARRLLVRKTATETVGIAEAISPQFVVRAVVSESVAIDDVQLIRQLFKPTLVEGIELAAAFVTPGGGVTTWAVNVSNGAVTEYDNYAFNSFAQMDGAYLAASSSGLYELQGDTDNGAAILARIKSGLLQMTGSNFTQFKGAYLGMRGNGEFVLRLITGDDETYDYGFSTDSMRTTRVILGKGLRARYFAFELLSEGQDFDIDTVEFVPLMNSRRA
jgi:hypothetical protein